MQIASCPGCCGKNYRPLGRLAENFSGRAGDQVFHQPDYRALLCPDCGLVFKSDTLDWPELERYYRCVDFTKWEISGLFPTERSVVRVLERLPDRSRVLDFGCSTGRLLARVCNRLDCFGLEMNPEAASVASAKGIQIIAESSLTDPNALKFDAIVLCDVFEHLPDPTTVLCNLSAHLHASGTLIVVTGNADAPAFAADIANSWYLRTVEHLCMMSRRYAEFLAMRINAKLTQWELCSHYDTPLLEMVKQHAQRFAYWTFHGNASALRRGFVALLPILRRARYWQFQPALNCTKDHVVAVFTKQALKETASDQSDGLGAMP